MTSSDSKNQEPRTKYQEPNSKNQALGSWFLEIGSWNYTSNRSLHGFWAGGHFLATPRTPPTPGQEAA
jgi:hypothetical protein